MGLLSRCPQQQPQCGRANDVQKCYHNKNWAVANVYHQMAKGMEYIGDRPPDDSNRKTSAEGKPVN